jgi:hypothetical protein
MDAKCPLIPRDALCGGSEQQMYIIPGTVMVEQLSPITTLETSIRL